MKLYDPLSDGAADADAIELTVGDVVGVRSDDDHPFASRVGVIERRTADLGGVRFYFVRLDALSSDVFATGPLIIAATCDLELVYPDGVESAPPAPSATLAYLDGRRVR